MARRYAPTHWESMAVRKSLQHPAAAAAQFIISFQREKVRMVELDLRAQLWLNGGPIPSSLCSPEGRPRHHLELRRR